MKNKNQNRNETNAQNTNEKNNATQSVKNETKSCK